MKKLPHWLDADKSEALNPDNYTISAFILLPIIVCVVSLIICCLASGTAKIVFGFLTFISLFVFFILEDMN